MNAAPPLLCQWDGESFVPIGRFASLADSYFVAGEKYQLVEHKQRSHATHAHYFACLQEAWANLPEHLAAQFPTADHLRRFALIKTGYADACKFVASSKAEAIRLAGFLRQRDPFSVVTLDGRVVTEWTAQSQSYREMDRNRFAASKSAVLEYVSQLISVAPGELAANAARAA
jgi:hypothetical protein